MQYHLTSISVAVIKMSRDTNVDESVEKKKREPLYTVGKSVD